MTGVLTLRCEVAEVARLLRFVEDFGRSRRLPDEVVFAVKVALEEVVSNIVGHGLGEGSGESVDIRTRLDATAWSFEVSDPGPPFSPLDRADPELDAPFEDRPAGGVGIFLVRRLVDELEYKRAGGRNVLTLRKRLTGAGQETDPPPAADRVK